MLPDRFDALIDRSGDCWLWTGHTERKGYGRVSYLGKRWRIHRLVYTLLVGPIPEGMTLDHLCRNRACVKPAHLEPVSIGENVLRGTGHSAENARKAECKRGHPFTEANTHIDPSGRRRCRACHRKPFRDVRDEGWYARRAERRLSLAVKEAAPRKAAA